MCPWIPPRAVTDFDCRVTAELRFNALYLSRERILSRFLVFEAARRATSLDAETSLFSEKPQTLQVPTRVLELLDTLPPQREQVLEVSLALTLATLRP